MSSEILTVICSRVRDSTAGVGGKIEHCGHCDEPIFVALSTYGILRREPSFALLCVECGVKMMEEGKEELELLPPQPEQMAEIKRAMFLKR